MAITDHDSIDGALRMQEEAPFFVIVGEEVTSADGDIIGYFLSERIPPGLSAEETMDRIHTQGGVVSLPHPCDTLRKHRFNPEKLIPMLERIDCFEVWNARNVFRSSNDRADAIADQHHLRKISASDTHTGFEVGRSGVEMTPFQTPQEFLQHLESATLIREKSPTWVHGITKIKKTFPSFFSV